MELRAWFRQSDRPEAKELDPLIKHYPCSDFRSPAVMRVFLVGFNTGFQLSDQAGQPTEALHALVAEMHGAQLCTGDQLPERERRNFIPKATPPQDIVRLWYVRGLAARLHANAMATCQHGWAWAMFPGLMVKRLTVTDESGRKTRVMHWVALVKPNWELNDNVYRGLWIYAGNNPKTQWDGYGFLERAGTARQQGMSALDGGPACQTGATAGAQL